MALEFTALAERQLTNVDRVDVPRSHTDYLTSDTVQYSICRFVGVE